jgi:hypothetical protein
MGNAKPRRSESMQDYTEILIGTVVNREGGTPIAGAVIEVYDKDMLSSQHLGTTHANGAGKFRLSFLWSDFKNSVFEGRPDIFLKVTDPANGKAMRSEVFNEVRGELDDNDVETMDLGEVPVS